MDDLDFDKELITVRDGKEAKTPLTQLHYRQTETTPPGADLHAKAGDRSWHHDTSNTTHIPPFFRHALTGTRT
jgi:hypothetical protein